MFRIAFRFRAALLLATVYAIDPGYYGASVARTDVPGFSSPHAIARLQPARRFFFLPRGRRCPHRGLATRWAVVARGPSLTRHPCSTSRLDYSKQQSRVSRLSSRCGTGRAAHRHTHTSHRACRPGPSATPRQAALSMTPLTHRSSQPLRDYMYSYAHATTAETAVCP